MDNVLFGFFAGFFATIPMSAVMIAGFYLLPRMEQYPLPPQEIVEQLLRMIGVKREVGKRGTKFSSVIAHFAYGTFTGGIYGLLADRVGPHYLLSGIAYGLLVWLGSYLVLLPVLQILKPATEHPARRNIMMIAAHLVWGLALGLIFGKLKM